jgi:small subunit ribosomal protein S6
MTLTNYETLFIVHPEKGPRIKEFIERFKKVIEDLAYRIQKQGKGYYTLVQYRASGRAVEELERNLRLTDGILRYLTVRDDEANQTAAQAPAGDGTEQGDKPPAPDATTDSPV